MLGVWGMNTYKVTGEMKFNKSVYLSDSLEEDIGIRVVHTAKKNLISIRLVIPVCVAKKHLIPIHTEKIYFKNFQQFSEF